MARPTPLVPGGYAEKVFNMTPPTDEATAVVPALQAIHIELQRDSVEIGAQAGLILVGAAEPSGARGMNKSKRACPGFAGGITIFRQFDPNVGPQSMHGPGPSGPRKAKKRGRYHARRAPVY
jgi:hypothetical protein